jgi:hypothetical protein
MGLGLNTRSRGDTGVRVRLRIHMLCCGEDWTYFPIRDTTRAHQLTPAVLDPRRRSEGDKLCVFLEESLLETCRKRLLSVTYWILMKEPAWDGRRKHLPSTVAVARCLSSFRIGPHKKLIFRHGMQALTIVARCNYRTARNEKFSTSSCVPSELTSTMAKRAALGESCTMSEGSGLLKCPKSMSPTGPNAADDSSKYFHTQ